MTPTAATRTTPSATASLRERLKDGSLLREQCYIDGSWVGVPVFPVNNPATGAELAKVAQLGAAETTQAVEAAARAFPAWAKLTAKQRSNLLRKWFELIVANREDLALILTSEQGKPLNEALGEVDIGAAYIEFFAEEARRVYGETIPTQKPDARLLALKQPIGVCGAITPWNFPNSMITRKVSPALAAGCTVVLKPANETPLSALALAVLAERAGIPKGVLNIITGDAPPIGKVLCEHPAVRFVGFTGSTEVGKILYRQSAGTVKKLGLELGGNLRLRQPPLCTGRHLRRLRREAGGAGRGDEDRRRHRGWRCAGTTHQRGGGGEGRAPHRRCGEGRRDDRHRRQAPCARPHLLRADGSIQREGRCAGRA